MDPDFETMVINSFAKTCNINDSFFGWEQFFDQNSDLIMTEYTLSIDKEIIKNTIRDLINDPSPEQVFTHMEDYEEPLFVYILAYLKNIERIYKHLISVSYDITYFQEGISISDALLASKTSFVSIGNQIYCVRIPYGKIGLCLAAFVSVILYTKNSS